MVLYVNEIELNCKCKAFRTGLAKLLPIEGQIEFREIHQGPHHFCFMHAGRKSQVI